MVERRTQVDVDKLSEAELREFVPSLLQQVASLEQQLAEFKRMLFGRRSEKSRYLDQKELLPFAELDALKKQLEEAKEAASAVEIPAHTRKKKNKRRNDFPDHLPRRRTTSSLTDAEKACPECGDTRVKIGVETTKELERIEFTYVHEMDREKYACRKCSGHVVIAPGVTRVLEKGILGGGFIAQIIFERFGNHMPYARLEKKYAAEGLSLSRSVMCRSAIKCADLLKPVYDAHVEDVLESLKTSVLQSDDTTVVQRNGNKSGQREVHVWAWRDQHAGVFYKATDSRNRDGPRQVVGDREGRLQCDGHDCYSGLDPGKIVRIGCWAHARRYFEKARKRGDKNAKQAMDWIGKLFAVEREGKEGRGGRELTDVQLVALRQEKSAPIIDALRAWLDDAQLHPPSLPEGPLMKGVGYALNQWDTLIRFLTDGRIREISNNGCERAMRATVIGRKNWYFFGSEEGADAAVVLMSLVQSCREHRVNPLLYLRDVLSAVSSTPKSKIRTLTPRAWKAREAEQERAQRNQDAIARAVRSLTFGA